MSAMESVQQLLDSVFPHHDFRWGHAHKGLCPFHQEKTPSLHLWTDRTNTAHYHCHGCGRGGKVSDLLEKDWRSMAKLTRSSLTVPTRGKPKLYTDEKINLATLNAVPWHRSSGVNSYLNQRGVSVAIRDEYGIMAAYDYRGESVLIPNVKTVNTRQAFTDFYVLRYLDGNQPKYMFPSMPKPLMFCHRHSSKRLTLVEGVFDALAFPGEAHPMLGDAISQTQIDEIKMCLLLYDIKKICLILDGGEREKKTSMTQGRRLANALNRRIFVYLLPDGKDPDELGEACYACDCKEVEPKS